jgi:hypothetical protein
MNNIDPITFYSVTLAGSIAGHRNDPLAWLLVIAAVSLGLGRLGVWLALIAAVIGTAIDVAVVWSWWREIGIVNRWISNTFWIFIVYVVVSAVAYTIGRVVGSVVGWPRRAT